MKAVYSLYISFVKAAPAPLKTEIRMSKTAATQRFTKLSPPPKPIWVLNAALYTVFRVSTQVQSRVDKMDI